MNGNVNEWCADTYRGWAYKKHKRTNPLFREEGYTKVYRGGSWDSKQRYARCATRNYEIGIESYTKFRAYRNSDLGFRLVRSK
jgi:formylglycine-generating enzyme required for sulfatase activity